MKVIRVDHATTTGTMETADVEVTDEQYERIVSVANSEGSCGYKSPHGRMVSSVAAAKLSDREVALVRTVLNFVNEMPGATVTADMIQAQFEEDMELVSGMKYVETEKSRKNP